MKKCNQILITCLNILIKVSFDPIRFIIPIVNTIYVNEILHAPSVFTKIFCLVQTVHTVKNAEAAYVFKTDEGMVLMR